MAYTCRWHSDGPYFDDIRSYYRVAQDRITLRGLLCKDLNPFKKWSILTHPCSTVYALLNIVEGGYVHLCPFLHSFKIDLWANMMDSWFECHQSVRLCRGARIKVLLNWSNQKNDICMIFLFILFYFSYIIFRINLWKSFMTKYTVPGTYFILWTKPCDNMNGKISNNIISFRYEIYCSLFKETWQFCKKQN